MRKRLGAVWAVIRKHPIVASLALAWAVLWSPPVQWYLDHAIGDPLFAWINTTIGAPSPALLRVVEWVAGNWYAIAFTAFLAWLAYIGYRLWKESRPIFLAKPQRPEHEVGGVYWRDVRQRGRAFLYSIPPSAVADGPRCAAPDRTPLMYREGAGSFSEGSEPRPVRDNDAVADGTGLLWCPKCRTRHPFRGETSRPKVIDVRRAAVAIIDATPHPD